MTSLFSMGVGVGFHRALGARTVINKRGGRALRPEGIGRKYSTIAYRAQQEAGLGRDHGPQCGRPRAEGLAVISRFARRPELSGGAMSTVANRIKIKRLHP